MNVPHKFVKIVSKEDYTKLVENQQKSENFRVRNRSHAILLSFKKYPIDEIAKICGVHRNAVSRWINRWKESALKGLSDVEKNGRPPILTLEEQAKTLEIALLMREISASATFAHQGRNGQDDQFLYAQKSDKKKT